MKSSERMIFRDVRKILVIKLRRIGDVLLTVPVFRALHETFPEAHISALVNSGTEDVLTGNPLIHEILVFDRGIKTKNPLQRYVQELTLLQRIRAKGFDMTIHLTEGDRGAIVSLFSGAKYRLAQYPGRRGLSGKRYFFTHVSDRLLGFHTVLKNLHVVRRLGIDTDNDTIDFFIPGEARMFARKILSDTHISENDQIVHVHPTSQCLYKCWKDEYMAEVMHWLVRRGVSVVITASPDKREMEKANRILSLVPSEREYSTGRIIDLCGKTTIKQVAAISEASDLFLGIDTGPMHIAAAVGTPVIAIFGTGEREWRPWGAKHLVISRETFNRNGMSREEYTKQNLAMITPDEVIGKIANLLNIAPWGSALSGKLSPIKSSVKVRHLPEYV
jgi:heptosyltransferase III